ncbi:MAG TPA: cupin domain-containing protein [Candidatus Udaeobacter sp.]|jgi:oxalate decarboxylase/phosphoglucose isomerase-like protein (cupin superfamily)|nr:cupin domain-containing protein [Candidatus Udaeobacter sp.]
MAEIRQQPADLKPERIDTYRKWQDAQRIPVIRGFFVEDVNTVELVPWDLKGVPCSFVVLDGTGGVNDAYICEIPPAGKTKPQRHLYEEMVYVTKGYGATTVWQRDGKKHTFEWGPGSLFAIPLNAHYQHFNASGSEAARYFAVTNSCFIINLFHNVDFVFDNDYAFVDRFDPNTEGYFSGKGEVTGRFFMTTNFVPDTHNITLADYSERGKGSTNMKFDLAKQTMAAHISEFPVGTYKKGHRHGPGAHVIILTGQGYSILWPEGQKMQRVDWKPGSVVVPPDQWFHQHFNSGAKPARYLALRWGSWRFRFMRVQDSEGSTYTSVKQGGGQIEFEDEDPTIHRDFEAAMKKVGATCQMGSYHPLCSEKSRAKAAS